MNPRLQKLTSDWKTYVALLAGAGAAFSAFTELVKKVTEGISALKGLPTEFKWVVAVVLGAVAAFLLIGALSRKSKLIEPKRFLISADDPNHLVGA